MELILWRHAESPPGYPDGERMLSAAGRHAARAMAQWLAPRLDGRERIIVSPARRAQETAQALGRAFVTDARLGTSATPEEVLETTGWPYGDERVIVVGHQPTLGAIAAGVLTGEPRDWAMAPGALWWVVRHEQARRAELRAYLTPELL
jgi:phosphohistidine phosphatase